jgi:hypothetical protein
VLEYVLFGQHTFDSAGADDVHLDETLAFQAVKVMLLWANDFEEDEVLPYIVLGCAVKVLHAAIAETME